MTQSSAAITAYLVEFAEGFLRNDPSGQWITRERVRLTRSIERAAGQGTGTPGMSR
jgi:hypothetical protein